MVPACGYVARVQPDLRRPTAALRVLAMTAVLSLAAGPALAAGSGSAPKGASEAVQFEPIPGTGLRRVILSPKAAERLGIETSEATKKTIIRKQMLGGQVVHESTIQRTPPSPQVIGVFGGFSQAVATSDIQPVATAVAPSAGGQAWVRLAVSQEEWDRIAQDRPAHVLPLGSEAATAVVAKPSELPPAADMKRSMLTVYYVVTDENHGLKINDRARVEVVLKGSGAEHLVVPYSAVYYDDEGLAWVYVESAPLTYERKRIEIERIQGDQAILKDGPPVGTNVVTIGASLLYGAEVIYKY